MPCIGLAMGGAADGLRFVAAPSFAAMALFSGLQGSGPDILCASGHDMLALTGMVPMYLLMSVLHLAPWLKLVAGRIALMRGAVISDSAGSPDRA
jgi:hypothetical protein